MASGQTSAGRVDSASSKRLRLWFVRRRRTIGYHHNFRGCGGLPHTHGEGKAQVDARRVAGIMTCAASSSINLARAAASVWMSESGPYPRARSSVSSRSASGSVEGLPSVGLTGGVNDRHPQCHHQGTTMSSPGQHERARRGPLFGARVIGGRETRWIVCRESRIGRGGQSSRARREPPRPPGPFASSRSCKDSRSTSDAEDNSSTGATYSRNQRAALGQRPRRPPEVDAPLGGYRADQIRASSR